MGYVQEARQNHVKKKVEEALRSKMKAKALKECELYTSKYAQCAAGRTLSVVWKCRGQAKELNECLHQLSKTGQTVIFQFQEIKKPTNDSVLEHMKKEYILQEEEKGL